MRYKNMCQKWGVLLALATVLCGCTTIKVANLLTDLETEDLDMISYTVGGFETLQCDPVRGQAVLIAWGKTLKNVSALASWPAPDNYLNLSFKNHHDYQIRTFAGSVNLGYSVVYADGVYTGEQLVLKNVCSRLGMNDKSLSVTPEADAPLLQR